MTLINTPAEYMGLTPVTLRGRIARFAMWRLLEGIPGFPAGTMLSDVTLRSIGYNPITADRRMEA